MRQVSIARDNVKAFLIIFTDRSPRRSYASVLDAADAQNKSPVQSGCKRHGLCRFK